MKLYVLLFRLKYSNNFDWIGVFDSLDKIDAKKELILKKYNIQGSWKIIEIPLNEIKFI